MIFGSPFLKFSIFLNKEMEKYTQNLQHVKP